MDGQDNYGRETTNSAPGLPPNVISNRTEGREILVQEQILRNQAREVPPPSVSREWEILQIARPVDVHTHKVEIPVQQEIRTVVPKVQIRETVKQIQKDEPTYIEKPVDVIHQKVVDTYVEKPILSGTTVKYIPKVDVHERKVLITKPEVKWVERYVDIPQIKEVVRYVESDSNVEQVIRYVPKGVVASPQPSKDFPTRRNEEPTEFVTEEAARIMEYEKQLENEILTTKYAEMERSENQLIEGAIVGPAPAVASPRTLPLTRPSAPQIPSLITPRPELYEQVIVPKVVRTVEVRKDVPVKVDVPVPFMVPKPVQIPVDVPMLKFRDHFVPVPVRRHVKPRVIFTEETYEVECIYEKPVLVIEDYVKPVPVDVQIKLKEKDITVTPIDPSELSQADMQATWMRVNADLLDAYRDAHGKDPAGLVKDISPESEGRDDGEDSGRFDKLDYGPIPLHPGHPLMMTYLQNQWIQNPSTVLHNMYSPEFFRLHSSALNAILDPQPHQINLSEEQAVKLGPLPRDQLPNTWVGAIPIDLSLPEAEAQDMSQPTATESYNAQAS